MPPREVLTTKALSHIAATLRQFQAERRTGNIKLNIRAGEILGMQVEEHLNLKAANKPTAGNSTRR